MTCDMNDECKERFREIDNRLRAGDKLFNQHSTDIAIIHTNVDLLIKSMNNLTKALWGVCGTVFATLAGFFVWYIQNI